jgi:hypothetical protein
MIVGRKGRSAVAEVPYDYSMKVRESVVKLQV